MLAPLCRSQVGPVDRHRGERYFRLDQVISLDWDDDVAYAEVLGSQDEPYAVRLDASHILSDRRLHAFCTCPRFAGGFFCKHIWATILTIDHDFSEASWGRGKVTLVADRSASSTETSTETSNKTPATRTPSSGASSKASSAAPTRTSETAPSWRARLQRVARLFQDSPSPVFETSSTPAPNASEPQGEAYFLLSSQQPRTSSGLLIDLYQRQPLQNGKLGKIKRLALKEEHIPTFTAAAEREALRLLLATPDPRPELTGAYAYSSYHHRAGRQRTLLPDALAELLLPKIAATERFFLYDDSAKDPLEGARPLAWDDGPPWRPELAVDMVDGEARVTGSLVRGDETRSPRDLRLTLESGCALLSHGTEDYSWARLEITPAHSWIWELAMGGEIRIPAAEVDDFLGDLWRLPSPDLLPLPDDLRLEPTTLEPVPRLFISTNTQPFGRDQVFASASFDYQGHTVPLDPDLDALNDDAPSSWADVDARKVLLRNPDFENQARASLGRKGFLASPSYRRMDTPWAIAQKKFFPAIEELLLEGWEIEGEEGGYRTPSTSSFQVGQPKGEIDWFTVEGSVTFGDQEVDLPELLKGLRSGKRTVRLKDGSTGVLPEAWQRRLKELSDLAIPGSSAKDRKTLRYLPSQTLLLDALLSTQDVAQVDRTAHFLQLREKMTHLQEVPPAQEPKGFQGELRPYQRTGLGWLQALAEMGLGGCLADDMGLGKTIQVLALLQSRRNDKPSLAVVPKTLVHNWIDEAHRFTPDLQVFEWAGKDRLRRFEEADHVDLIVATYGTLRRDIETLQDIQLDYAILDEAQAIKNAGSQTAKACRLLPAPRRLALTGTPVENSLADLWSIFEFLNPGMLGRSKVFLDILKSRAITEEEADLLRRVLTPFLLRRTKEEVLPDLPAKTEQVLLCDLDTTERRLYDQLRTHYHRQLRQKIDTDGIKRSKIHVLEALLRLRQAACHPGLLNPSKAERKGSKIELLLAHLQDATGAGHKSLVFSQFTSFLALVRQHLDDLGMPYLYLDGKSRNRKQLVDTFQTDPTIPVFLISLKAGGSGLNLTAADYVFLLDPWWNPAVERQAIDRTHRIGQTRPVLAYRLIATDTVEEKVLKLQETKKKLAEAILTQNDSVLRQLTQEDLDYLLS